MYSLYLLLLKRWKDILWQLWRNRKPTFDKFILRISFIMKCKASSFVLTSSKGKRAHSSSWIFVSIYQKNVKKTDLGEKRFPQTNCLPDNRYNEKSPTCLTAVFILLYATSQRSNSPLNAVSTTAQAQSISAKIKGWVHYRSCQTNESAVAVDILN